MPVFDQSMDIIPLLRPVVRLNGSRNDTIKCTKVTMDPGSGGVRAEFEAPQYAWDRNRRGLTDGFVSVTMRDTYDDSDDGNPDFLGYVDPDNADLSEGTNGINFSAMSITGYFSKVGIGDWDNVPVLKYPLVNSYNGEPTEWTPKRILIDLLDRLPPRYRSRVAIGDSAVLDTTQLNNLPDLEFRFCTYAKAIEDILALFGDVTFTERYSGGRAYLDFYRIQSSGMPTATVKLANYTDPIQSGANVENISHEQSTTDAITRVKAYGTKKRYILSVVTYGPNPDANLVKGWDPAQEEAVLRDPRSATPGGYGYVAGMENVARRFYLPAALRPYLKLKDLGIRRAPVGDQLGPEIKVQVWKLPVTLAMDEEGVVTGTEQLAGQLINSVKLELDKGYFEISNLQDALNVVTIETSESGKLPKTTWALAKIGITLCVEGNQYLVADTGPDSSSGILFDIAEDGLYDRITRDDLTFVQATNLGKPVKSPGGVDCEWGAYVYNEDTQSWINFSEATVIKDDGDKLMTVAREHLRAKNKRHHAYNVGVPYFSRAFRPGYRLVVDGQANWPNEHLTTTSVAYDFASNRTEMVADNVKPPKRRNAEVADE